MQKQNIGKPNTPGLLIGIIFLTAGLGTRVVIREPTPLLIWGIVFVMSSMVADVREKQGIQSGVVQMTSQEFFDRLCKLLCELNQLVKEYFFGKANQCESDCLPKKS